MYKLICVAYCIFFIGLGAGQVGQITTTVGEPYPWYLPLLIAVFIITPAVLGYMAGKDERS